jgi:hypothetical protein
MLDRVRDRLRRDVWHALNGYDELQRRVRENGAGRSAVAFAALVLLGLGAALGFIAANAAAREDVTELTPARASNVVGLYTVTQAIVSQRTVRVRAAQQKGREPHKMVTVTTRSPTLPARTVAFKVARTIMRTRTVTVTVTDVQPTTVTVVSTEDKKGKP